MIGDVAFTVYGDPAPAGSKTRATSPDGSRTWVRDSSKRSYPWKAAVSAAAGEAMNGDGLLDGPLFLSLTFFRTRPSSHFGTGRNAGVLKPSAPAHPTKKPDVLKLARAVEDAMTGIVYRDDAQIVVERLEKRFDSGPSRVEVFVTNREYLSTP